MSVNATAAKGRRLGIIVLAAILCACAGSRAIGAVIWIEGEKPTRQSMHRHPWWYDQVNKELLSGGDFISNWDDTKAGEAEYDFAAPQAGEYEFWVRANPVGTRLSFALNGEGWTPIEMSKKSGETNIAADGKIDLRFIAWVRAGQVKLKKGDNSIRFRMDSENHNHGMLDCFVFSTDPFQPRGILKPEQIAKEEQEVARGEGEWFAFDPKPDPFTADSAIDLRLLNEKVAGEGGFIEARGGHFVHGKTGQPVRFWAVNGPPAELKDPKTLRDCARMLAKYGVNLVRIHGGYFNEDGSVDMARVQHALDIVEAMKAEGIYCHFSTYFPLWLAPRPGTPWLAGYDGSKHPFAALYFNPEFQSVYDGWWKALLTTPSKTTGHRLIDDPAVFGLEIINEDSYFFWTFAENNVPDAELKIVEAQFGNWLKKKYGSLDAALAKWNGLRIAQDNVGEGRIAFRPLWTMFNERTQRDKDTAAFLTEAQRGFYQREYDHLRGLGFKGVICASNWATASPQYFGPLEKYTYTVCDFIDRHGYFGCDVKGPNDGWAIMNDQTYADRDALKFDNEQPGKPRDFVHPAMDIKYDGKPSMISETTFNRPNRYRSEAPLYYACYGALQDSDCIVHFALDADRWSVKPNYFMQPWTLASPAMMGQFPAAALIYREGLVSSGQTLVELNLGVAALEDLQGTPMPQDASFDELRAKDVPRETKVEPGNVIDPLVHYAGRTGVAFSARGGEPILNDLKRFIDRQRRIVTSTTGELALDYGRGILRIDAPAAQGVSGNLHDAGTVDLRDLTVTSDLPLGNIVAVSLDAKPLDSSRKILLQVMSEEQASGWQTTPASDGLKRITSIGHDPWMVKRISGSVKLKRADSGALKVEALDSNGYPQRRVGAGSEIPLAPDVTYYLITAP